MSTGERRTKGGHVGSLFLATVLGVGVGMLAAPQTGTQTRRALRRRIAALGEDFGDELEELEERRGRMGRAVRERAEQLRRRGRKTWKKASEALDDLDDDYEDELDEELEEADEEEDSSALPTVLTVAAGLAAAAWLLTSERAAPTRERVREAAATVRDEAEARWDRFQHRRGESSEAPGPAPQAS
jgi:gas vesicle protein